MTSRARGRGGGTGSISTIHSTLPPSSRGSRCRCASRYGTSALGCKALGAASVADAPAEACIQEVLQAWQLVAAVAGVAGAAGEVGQLVQQAWCSRHGRGHVRAAHQRRRQRHSAACDARWTTTQPTAPWEMPLTGAALPRPQPMTTATCHPSELLIDHGVRTPQVVLRAMCRPTALMGLRQVMPSRSTPRAPSDSQGSQSTCRRTQGGCSSACQTLRQCAPRSRPAPLQPPLRKSWLWVQTAAHPQLVRTAARPRAEDKVTTFVSRARLRL